MAVKTQNRKVPLGMIAFDGSDTWPTVNFSAFAALNPLDCSETQDKGTARIVFGGVFVG